MQSILILSFSPIASDPRVMRQIRLLESRAALTVAGFAPAPDASIEFLPLPAEASPLPRKAVRAVQLLFGWSDAYYWSRPEAEDAFEGLAGRRFDVVIANDIATLPLALRLADGSPVLIDAHEFSPREFEDRLWWRLLFGRYYDDLCRRYLARTAAMTTVCRGIADEYARSYGVAPVVIENAPSAQKLGPSPLDGRRVRMIHHGAAIRSRRLEAMIEVVDALDERFTLDFMLVPNEPAYLRELRERAAANPRIRFIAPVGMPEICQSLNRYDLGLFLLPPVNFNYRYALPNKFFEFVQARLAVAVGPSPEMARLVREHALGIVAPSFEPSELAAMLTAMTEDELTGYKLAAERAATMLSFEAAGARLLALLHELSGRQSSARKATLPCAA
jgi:glycosyltransferase involved in cell wall biosynthesis